MANNTMSLFPRACASLLRRYKIARVKADTASSSVLHFLEAEVPGHHVRTWP